MAMTSQCLSCYGHVQGCSGAPDMIVFVLSVRFDRHHVIFNHLGLIDSSLRPIRMSARAMMILSFSKFRPAEKKPELSSPYFCLTMVAPMIIPKRSAWLAACCWLDKGDKGTRCASSAAIAVRLQAFELFVSCVNSSAQHAAFT